MRSQRHPFSIISFALLWLPLFAVAQQSNHVIVRSLAQKVWQQETIAPLDYTLKHAQLNLGDLSYAVVVRTDKAGKDTLPGYMLIAEGNGTPTLLAYDRDAKFSLTKLPPHIQTWIKGYESMRATSREGQSRIRAWLEASQGDHEDVSPLLGKREWGQDNPYNLLCPVINGKQSPSGCVATALSQIMCYHRWPEKGTGNISYTTTTQHIDIDYDFESTTFEWDKMLDVYLPFVNLSSNDDVVFTDNKYSLSSLSVDDNSNTASKCFINITGLTAIGSSFFEGEVVLVLTDMDGNCSSRASSDISVLAKTSGRIINNKSILMYVPSTLPDGIYRLHCAVRSIGTDQWSLANRRNGDNDITVSKHGSQFTIDGNTFPCSLTEEEVTPVSKLLQAVGAAVMMDYGPTSSGAFGADARQGMVQYLHYDSDMFMADPNAFTDKQWHEMLQQELVEGRPVYYSGQGTESGHAFVIDGFQKSDDGTTYYHVNWGWDGLCNGYYLLNMLRPSSTGTGGSSGSNYSNMPSMFIGMKPEDGVSAMQMNCGGIELLDDEFFPGHFLPLRIQSLSLMTGNDFKGKLQIELKDESGKRPVMVLYESSCTITSKRGLADYYVSCQIPQDVPEGNYSIWLNCTTDDGEPADIKGSEYPVIHIKGLHEWKGGSLTQSMQQLAVGGTIGLQVDETEGSVTLTVDSIVNPMPEPVTGQMGILVCNENGWMQSLPTEMTFVSVGAYQVRRNVVVSTPVSRHAPDGQYTLSIGFLPVNDSLWTFCDRIYCKENIWWASYRHAEIPMTISQGIVTILDEPDFEGADIPWTDGIDLPHSQLCGLAQPKSFDSPIYDLYGRKSPMLHRGIYLIKRNNKVVKAIK